MQEKLQIVIVESMSSSVHKLLGDKIIMVAANPYSLPPRFRKLPLKL